MCKSNGDLAAGGEGAIVWALDFGDRGDPSTTNLYDKRLGPTSLLSDFSFLVLFCFVVLCILDQ